MKLKAAEDMKNYNKYMNNRGTDNIIRKKFLKRNVLPWKFVCQNRSDCTRCGIEEVF